MKVRIRDERDFYSGLIFILFGLATLFFARGYSLGSAVRMGPGYFPTTLGALLAGLGFVIAFAMVINLVAGALGGILIPLALNRFKADPAVSSGVFVTTVTDVVGFFAFLGIATLWFRLA